MGWISKIFGMEQVSTGKTSVSEEIHVNDIEEWLSTKEKELLSTNSLGVGVDDYTKNLRRATSAVEQIMEDWEGQLVSVLKEKKHSTFFARLRHFLDVVDVP